MKRSPSFIVIALIAVFTLAACSKGGTVTDDGSGHVVSPDDTTPPDIIIFTPSAGQVFNSGNVINITGRITDDLGLYRGTIKVVNDATSAVLLNQPYEIHGQKLYNFNINYTPSVTTASDYSVIISFEDHGANTTTRSAAVKVNP